MPRIIPNLWFDTEALEAVDANDDAATDEVLNDFAREHADELEDGQRFAAYVEEECGIRFANPIG